MTDPNISSGWIVAGILGIVSSLAGAVATLFKMNETKSTLAVKTLELRIEGYAVRLDDSDRKHQECLEDRIELSKQIARLEGRLSHFISDVNEAGSE